MRRADSSAWLRSMVMSSATMEKAWGKKRMPMNAVAAEKSARAIQKAGRLTPGILILRRRHADQIRDRAQQRRRIDRLRDVAIVAGRERPDPIVLARVRGHRDARNPAAPVRLAVADA